MKFKNDIEAQSNIILDGALTDAGGSPGTVNQLLSSTATGTAWIDPSTIVAEAATLVVIACKNTSGATIAQGTPVYQTGTVGATATIEIAPADALISENKLPAIGLLQAALNNNGFGFVVITGELTNFTTSPIDGVVPTTGDKIFVKSGGGLTLTKPTGEGNGIQNMGLVGKVSSGNSGSITVSSIMRTNDVPNLPEGRIWVGDGNTIVSDTVYVDEPNNRVGIGNANPNDYSADANNLVVGSLAGNNGITILSTSTSGYGSLYFADSAVGNKVYSGYIRYQQNLSNMTFGTNEAERMRIDVNGNVGIGTTSPSEKLEVDGNILSIGTVTSPTFLGDLNGTINTATTGTTQTAGDNSTLIATTAYADAAAAAVPIGDYVTLATTQTISGAKTFNNDVTLNNTYLLGVDKLEANQIVIGTSTSSILGNVGIGTTSPIGKLDINTSTVRTSVNGGADELVLQNDGYSGMTILSSGTTAAQIHFGDDFMSNSGMIQYWNNVDSMAFSTGGGNERMRINSAGNVGIGTTNPGAKLDIEGSANLLKLTHNNGYIEFVNTADNARTGYLQLNSDSASALNVTVNQDLHFATNNTNRLTILSGGNVGIGTTSPGAKLHLSNPNMFTTVWQRFTNGTTGTSYTDGTWMGIGSDGSFSINNKEALGVSIGTSDLERFSIGSAGSIQFNSYDSTNNTGTPTYLLGTDASGNVVKTNTVTENLGVVTSSLYATWTGLVKPYFNFINGSTSIVPYDTININTNINGDVPYTYVNTSNTDSAFTILETGNYKISINAHFFDQFGDIDVFGGVFNATGNLIAGLIDQKDVTGNTDSNWFGQNVVNITGGTSISIRLNFAGGSGQHPFPSATGLLYNSILIERLN